jgi:long-chain acyl-CoA synthetase
MTEDVAGTGPRPRNLAELVTMAARLHPDKPALVTGAGHLTWGELDEQTGRLAAGVRGRLDPGDRILLALGNTVDFVVGYFAALRAGAVAVPVNPGLPAAELVPLVVDSGARLALAGPDARDAVTAAADRSGVPLTLADAADLAELATGGSADPVGGAEDLAVLLYTAGTSGRPKGAMLSHRALLANVDQLRAVRPELVTPDDVVLLVLPLFHVYGLNAALGLLAAAGATGVLLPRFDPVEALEEVRRRGVTNVVGAPPMFVAWSMLPDLAAAFAGVRVAVSGAAPLPAEVWQAVRAASGREILEGYGLTETGPVLTTSALSERVKPGSVGRPLPGVDLRLVGDDGCEVDEDDPGEIVVRGANLFSGYWPDGRDGPDRDGWFATGDLAVADEDGDLFLVGRRGDLILVSGFNVYPREVEQVLERHPDIAEVAVVGLPHPYTGETVKAYVVPRAGSHLDSADVTEFAARSLARFKCPTAVEFVADLPHSAAGKLARGRIRDGGADRSGEPVPEGV